MKIKTTNGDNFELFNFSDCLLLSQLCDIAKKTADRELWDKRGRYLMDADIVKDGRVHYIDRNGKIFTQGEIDLVIDLGYWEIIDPRSLFEELCEEITPDEYVKGVI